MNPEPEKAHVGTAIRLRIQEEPLSALRLVATLSTFLSFYVKLWLLQQGRLADFVSFLQHNRRFAEEANLTVVELKYHSPAVITFTLDLSPKTLVEALQMLIDMIVQLKLRIREKEEAIRAQHMETLAKAAETMKALAAIVEILSPNPAPDKKELILQGLIHNMLTFAGDENLEISFLPSFLPDRSAVSSPRKAQSVSQEKTASQEKFPDILSPLEKLMPEREAERKALRTPPQW